MKHLHDKLFIAGQLKISDFEELKNAGIKIIINNRPDNEEPGQMSSDDAAKLAIEHGMEYHYLPMANGQPMPENLVNDFKTVLQNADDKVLAHCRSGMRSSFIWALGKIADGNISVDQAIEAAAAAGIPLNNARAVLENVQSGNET